MPFLLGTDEAGYGPNLGPLAITVTVWRVPDGLAWHELYDRLRAVITTDARLGHSNDRLEIADSKLLYQSRGSLARLERAVLAGCGLLGRPVATWRDAWQAIAPDCLTDLDAEPWSREFVEPLPLDCLAEDISRAVETLGDGLSACDVQLVDMRSRVLFPRRFNDLVDLHGSKGEVLSRATLELAHDAMQSLGNEPVLLICDKHGGRNKYGPLLQSIFIDDFVEVRKEGRAASDYRWGRPPQRVEARFIAKGEGYLPAALASMVSKYLRELAMRAFNHYWRQHVPDIRPTAGYPIDAKRFKRDIADVQSRLGIADRVLWRSR